MIDVRWLHICFCEVDGSGYVAAMAASGIGRFINVAANSVHADGANNGPQPMLCQSSKRNQCPYSSIRG